MLKKIETVYHKIQDYKNNAKGILLKLSHYHQLKDIFLNLTFQQVCFAILFVSIQFYLISTISCALLQIPFSIWPAFFLSLMLNGFSGTVLLVSGIVILADLIPLSYLAKGFYRWLAYQMVIISVGSIFACMVGFMVFAIWSGWHSVLMPWQYVHFYQELKHYPLLQKRFIHCIGFSLLIYSILHIFIYYTKNSTRASQLGDAKFANPLQMKKAGFFEEEGIIVGQAYGKPLRAGGYEHALVFAPAGSGKTTSIAIPNLLTWSQSCVVNDPKMELFELTSGHRQNVFGNKVFLWAPTKEKTHRYNPLSFISKDKNKRISDIQLITHTIIPNGSGEPIWYQSSRELFLALILYLLDTEHETVTLPQVYVLSKQYKFNDWLKYMIEKTHDLDPEFYRNASGYLNAGEKTRASILKTFTGYLEIFANPVINAATSASDFDIRALRKEKMTIYVGFSENEKEMISPLLTIFWQQLISFMCEKIPARETEPYDLLCLMEEFSILGRLVNLKSSLKILRGYHVRVLIIIQYFSQTLEFYSKAEAEAFKNIKTKVSFALDSYEDAQYMSQLLGMQTKKITSHGSTSHFEGGSTSKNTQLQAVPLMRPEEIQRLKPYKAIILRTGSPPVMAKQYRWYKVRALKKLKQKAVFIPDQIPQVIPFQKPTIENSVSEETISENKSISTIYEQIEK